MNIHVNVTGEEQAISRFEQIEAQGDEAIQRTAEAILRILRAEILKNFSTESNAGQRWAALAPYTLRFKRGPQKLIETYRMYNSLIGLTPDSIVEIAPLRLRYGTRVPYAIKHEEGGVQVDGRRIPARPFMPQAERVNNPIADAIARNMTDAYLF